MATKKSTSRVGKTSGSGFSFKWWMAALLILVVAGIGIYVLRYSHASTNYTVEVDPGRATAYILSKNPYVPTATGQNAAPFRYIWTSYELLRGGGTDKTAGKLSTTASRCYLIADFKNQEDKSSCRFGLGYNAALTIQDTRLGLYAGKLVKVCILGFKHGTSGRLNASVVGDQTLWRVAGVSGISGDLIHNFANNKFPNSVACMNNGDAFTMPSGSSHSITLAYYSPNEQFQTNNFTKLPQSDSYFDVYSLSITPQ